MSNSELYPWQAEIVRELYEDDRPLPSGWAVGRRPGKTRAAEAYRRYRHVRRGSKVRGNGSSTIEELYRRGLEQYRKLSSMQVRHVRPRIYGLTRRQKHHTPRGPVYHRLVRQINGAVNR